MFDIFVNLLSKKYHKLSAYQSKSTKNKYLQKKIRYPTEMSRFLKDRYLKLNRILAHKTKLPEEEKNKALFRVVIFMQ